MKNSKKNICLFSHSPELGGAEKCLVDLIEILLQNKIKTQEDVINRINKIDKHDISYVLERCFKPGIISTAFVGQGVETDKLNSILENSKVAYKNSIDKKFLL